MIEWTYGLKKGEHPISEPQKMVTLVPQTSAITGAIARLKNFTKYFELLKGLIQSRYQDIWKQNFRFWPLESQSHLADIWLS